jgi:NADPH:quinone reductase-like Zn-dependent oxidoreductase
MNSAIRTVQFSRLGGPEVLEFVEVPLPVPGDDEVLIRVKAIGMNRSDSMFRRGEYIIQPTFPAQFGSEAAGIVEAVGKNVTGVAVGEMVNTVPSFWLGDVAIYGEAVAVPAHAVVKQPARLSSIQAAALWVMYLTPYGALIEDANIQPGEFVLISAASSSTALGAIQIANLVGAIPIALTRTSAKRQQLFDAGAKHVVAYNEVDVVEDIMTFTEGKGARVAFDPVGGRLLPELAKAMPWKGTIYSYGALDGETTTIPVMQQIIGRMLTIKGWAIVDTLWDAERLAAAVAFISAGVEAGKLQPVIDKIFTFEDVVAAHEHLERSDQFGKIVISLSE